ALLYRPSRAALWRHRARLLDETDGPARGDPFAGRLRQQCRAAAFLLVRPDCLWPRSLDRGVADAGRLRAAVWHHWRATDSQSLPRPLQRARRVALDLFLPARADADFRHSPLRPQSRTRRHHDEALG